MSDSAKDEVRDRLGNIDQIRDIIFGSQIRDYDNRLSKIESDLLLIQQDGRDRLEQVKSILESEIRTVVEALEKKLKSYQALNQEECADLRQQSDRLNKKFVNTIQSLDESVHRQFSSVRTEISETKTKLREDVNALRDLVLEELDRRFSSLQDAKVSRDDIAETLFELGMRIKGTEFIPALKEVGENNVENVDPLPLLATRKHIEEIHHR
ncbi:hypothetical protein LEP3755_53640 [Leptolyngbya sp. NIES-3755]|nr:hypothetical protein LEP3755_53640 [Leptolyngbya sp. NIES-3755]